MARDDLDAGADGSFPCGERNEVGQSRTCRAKEVDTARPTEPRPSLLELLSSSSSSLRRSSSSSESERSRSSSSSLLSMTTPRLALAPDPILMAATVACVPAVGVRMPSSSGVRVWPCECLWPGRVNAWTSCESARLLRSAASSCSRAIAPSRSDSETATESYELGSSDDGVLGVNGEDSRPSEERDGAASELPASLGGDKRSAGSSVAAAASAASRSAAAFSRASRRFRTQLMPAGNVAEGQLGR
jgi:hypothetical protein